MTDPTALEDLLLLWEEERQKGRTIPAEELCRDRPELLEEARRRIRALEAIGRVPNRLGSVDETVFVAGPATGRVSSPRQVADYEVLGLLGRGGMGVVYEARQATLGRPVALKMIVAGAHASPAELARFRIEAEAVARLQHPNVVTIHEVGEHDGQPFLAMEWLEGGSLERRLDGKPRPAEDAARMIEALARAVDHAHQRGIVHRDLKPANVLLAGDGTPKVGDFGLAKLLGDEPGESRADFRTRTGAVVGTPSYMSPEQAGGDGRAIGPATDIHALGVILYELLTGGTPFRGTSPLETLEQVRSLDPVPPRRLRPTLSRELEAICLRCLEKEPGRRYASAGELADDLGRFLNGEPVHTRSSGVLERLTGVLSRGQHDKEFRLWSNVVLATVPIASTAHLIVFAVALLAPVYLRAAFILPWALFLAVAASLVWINRTRIRLPNTPAVRQAGALLLGHVVASSLLSPTCRVLGLTAYPADEVKLYPFLTLLVGQLYCSLGGSYWGGCYLVGLGFILASPLMAAAPTWAPLEFAVVFATGQLAIGLHLRRLAREP